MAFVKAELKEEGGVYTAATNITAASGAIQGTTGPCNANVINRYLVEQPGRGLHRVVLGLSFVPVISDRMQTIVGSLIFVCSQDFCCVCSQDS